MLERGKTHNTTDGGEEKARKCRTIRTEWMQVKREWARELAARSKECTSKAQAYKKNAPQATASFTEVWRCWRHIQRFLDVVGNLDQTAMHHGRV